MSTLRRRAWPWGQALAWAALLAVLGVTLWPLFMAFKTAIQPHATLFQEAASLWPERPTLDHFKRVLGLLSPQEALALGGSGADIQVLRALWNSLGFTLTVVVVNLQFGHGGLCPGAFALPGA